MVILKNGNRIYYPKLTIRSCLAIDKLFGDVIKPLLTFMSVETQALLLSLSLQQYRLTDDELYDLMDSIKDLDSLFVELYKEAGLISDKQSEDAIEDQSESNNDTRELITFESHMMDLLEQCMSVGMREEDFYSSTISHVTRYVNAYQKQQENQLQEKAFMDYQLANLIGLSVARLMSKSTKYPPFEKAYPFIKVNDKKEVNQEWEMELQRIKLMEWAEQMNKKLNVAGGE